MVIALLVICVASLSNEAILRNVGWALVASVPVEKSEFIVISAVAGGAGSLEAADLVGAGVASRVAVFEDPPSGEDHEFIRRGLPYDDLASRQIGQLRLLGVANVIRIPRSEIGTDSEARFLLAWCAENGIGSVVFVAARDHSRRVRRVIARTMAAQATRISVRSTNHSQFDPDNWWKSRNGMRTLIVEMQKLALDVLLHPLQL